MPPGPAVTALDDVFVNELPPAVALFATADVAVDVEPLPTKSAIVKVVLVTDMIVLPAQFRLLPVTIVMLVTVTVLPTVNE